MNKQASILRTGFALFSLLTSFLFVFYAVSVITSEGTSTWLKTFAYVAGGYGLMNVYILSWAWNSRASWSVPANLLIAVCFFGTVVMDLFRDGLPEARQLGSVLGLAAVLGINWFAVRKMCQRDNAGAPRNARKKR